MPKFKVELSVIYDVVVEIEADDEEEAREKAKNAKDQIEQLVAGDDPATVESFDVEELIP